MWERLLSHYGMLFVLLALCAGLSVLTIAEQHPIDRDAARRLAADLLARGDGLPRVLIAVPDTRDDRLFADALGEALRSGGASVRETVAGSPRDARAALQRIADAGDAVDVIACTQISARWLVFQNLKPDVTLAVPRSYWWPNFLKRDNLFNVANQIAINAIVAIGMTIVIITGGIDLSVGSLMAFSAVMTCLAIRDFGGAREATWVGMTGGCLVGISVAGLVGLFTGTMVTLFRIPPFIVTLAVMQIASGLAYITSKGQSVNQVPAEFVWLASGTPVGEIPNAVWLMAGLYLAAHLLMSHTVMGRYLYAVGGNAESARLSGVPVVGVLLFAYLMSGLLAGLGGVVLASQFKSGSPNFGLMAELYIIAAVVVGGTSLSGGEGRMLGTLIGAFIVAVVQNGMNLLGIDPYMQRVVLGGVILFAVLLDRVKHWFWRRRGERSEPEPA